MLNVFRDEFKQRGSAMLMGLGVFAALGGGLMLYMNSMSQQNKELKDMTTHSESHVSVEKLRTFGSFLVSSNSVICKQAPFTGQTEGYRCKWTGKQLVEGKLEDVSQSKLGITKESIDAEGFLSFDVDTKQVTGDAGADVVLKGKMGFKLYDAEKDELGIGAKLGTIPVDNLMSDSDRAVVLMKIEVSVENTDPGTNTKRVVDLRQFFSTRRPIAIPKITTGQINCRQSCETALSVNDNPSCRSPQGYEHTDTVEVQGTTENLGPGVLYDLRLAKSITLVSGVEPTSPIPDVSQVLAMPNGRDYLLPGEKVNWVDVVECIETKRTETVSSVGGTSSTTVSQHFENAGQIEYSADISKVKLSTFQTYAAQLRDQFPEGVPLKHTIPAEYSATPVAVVEPARTVNKIVTTGDFPTRVETTVMIIAVPSH